LLTLMLNTYVFYVDGGIPWSFAPGDASVRTRVGIKMQTFSHVFTVDVIKAKYMESGLRVRPVVSDSKVAAGTLVLIGL
jgi:hypothetical protein